MATEAEELQAKEFLKRAEIKTMRKDLSKLREADSLKERDKIAKIKTLEEQLEEKNKFEASTAPRDTNEVAKMEAVLTQNEKQERVAEKDLKNYAKEEEKQQIFLLESQRLGFEKQIDAIDKEKDPALKLEKNKLLLQKREQEAKLNSILDQEKKLENEQKFIAEKSQASNLPAEKKSLEQSRWDLDQKIQDVEKRRWAVEKEIQGTDNRISEIDKSSEQLVAEKNELRNKVLGIDKSLRDIYSVVMSREEDKRRGQSGADIAEKEELAKARAEEREKVQREQWSGFSSKKQAQGEIGPRKNLTIKEKFIESNKAEDERRKKFLRDVEGWAQSGDQPKQEPLVVPGTKAIPPPPVPRRSV